MVSPGSKYGRDGLLRMFNDLLLIKRIKNAGSTGQRSLWSRRRLCAGIDWSADQLALVLQKHTRPGNTNPVWDDDRDRVDYYGQDVILSAIGSLRLFN